MNKQYRNKIIDALIDKVISIKENITEEIIEISTTFEYHSYSDSIDLNKQDIQDINELRHNMLECYNLISDLEKIRYKNEEE